MPPTSTDSELVQRILAIDYTAQAAARDAGPSASALILPLLNNEDEEVRQLAVLCLQESGGSQISGPLVAALKDSDVQVSMAAARALKRWPAGHNALLETFHLIEEPEVRREVALLIGRDDAVTVEQLRRTFAAEADAHAREGLLAARARKGDNEARRAFVAELRRSAAQRREALLQLSEYVGQNWLLPGLEPVLADKTALLRVAVDAFPNAIQALRACDLAVVAVASIAASDPPERRLALSFPVNRSTNYEDAQLAEVQGFLRGLSRPEGIYGSTASQ